MTQEDIIRMAREAGLWEIFTLFSNEFGNADPEEDCMKELERFAQLVAAAEREACAKVADRHSTCANDTPNVIAVTIRARGQQ